MLIIIDAPQKNTILLDIEEGSIVMGFGVLVLIVSVIIAISV